MTPVPRLPCCVLAISSLPRPVANPRPLIRWFRITLTFLFPHRRRPRSSGSSSKRLLLFLLLITGSRPLHTRRCRTPLALAASPLRSKTPRRRPRPRTIRRRRRTTRRIRVAHITCRAPREHPVRVVDDWFPSAGRGPTSPARCAARDGSCAAATAATGGAADGAAFDVVVEAFDDVACCGGFFQVGGFSPVDLFF